MDNVTVMHETVQNSATISSFLASDTFILIVTILFAIIMVIFSRRLNKLEESIKNLNNRIDSLATTLVEISGRPCQLESHGFNVEITDPTGKKLREITRPTSS